MNGALIGGTLVASSETPRFLVGHRAASNFHCGFARHEFVLVNGRTPESGHFHDGFSVSGVHNRVVGRLVFGANRDGPHSGRNNDLLLHAARLHGRIIRLSLLLLLRDGVFFRHNVDIAGWENLRGGGDPKGTNDWCGQVDCRLVTSQQKEKEDCATDQHAPFHHVGPWWIPGRSARRANEFGGKHCREKRPLALFGPSFAFLFHCSTVAVHEMFAFFGIRRHFGLVPAAVCCCSAASRPRHGCSVPALIDAGFHPTMVIAQAKITSSGHCRRPAIAIVLFAACSGYYS